MPHTTTHSHAQPTTPPAHSHPSAPLPLFPPHPIDRAISHLQDADIRALLTNQANPRGIPTVRFIEDVDSFMKKNELTTEVLIGAFTELHQK